MLSCGEIGEHLRKSKIWTESLEGTNVSRWKNSLQAEDKDMQSTLKVVASQAVVFAGGWNEGFWEGNWVSGWKCWLGLESEKLTVSSITRITRRKIYGCYKIRDWDRGWKLF